MPSPGRARYVGSRPSLRGLGLTALVQDHPKKSGLILVQLDDIGRWTEQMELGRNYQDRGWAAYKRTSWQTIHTCPIEEAERLRREREDLKVLYLQLKEEIADHV